jgi:predicted glycogen debranching enzyme
MLDFGREVCGYRPLAERREWLVTNGIGGYACGTVAGLLTRRYHGLLIAALDPPLGRTLLLTKLDEIATYDGRDYSLFANRWADGAVEPTGFRHLERFRLEGTTPAWTFACADALLEKRVWMEPGANTTYVRYALARASAPITLNIKAMVNYRDHHGSTQAHDWRMRVESTEHGLRIVAFDGATPLYVLSNGADVVADHTWYRGYLLAMEDYRGLDARDEHLYVGRFRAGLQPGESLLVVASTDATLDLDPAAALDRRRVYEDELLRRGGVLSVWEDASADVPPWEQHLVLAADQFIVRRSLPEDLEGSTIIAGYPWFGDWGRDTMISLPGLTLVTGRHGVAERILRTFAHFVDQGMLPNRFPDEGQRPEYNTVDATLWYLEAIRSYRAATDDEDLLRDLFPVLREIVTWYERGTRYNIHVDPNDGLLYAGEPGVQLTWMDAKVGDWVVTPRIGKAVEINALWYNALRIMADFAHQLEEPAGRYEILAERARSGFARFWNKDAGYCCDVLDGPDGDDLALRPNQLFAVSLPYSPLREKQQKAVVDACARHLLTSHGLRSLSPDNPAYIGHYGGDQRQRDAAYHQGTVWAWLIGPFVTAHLRVYGDPGRARSFLESFVHHLGDHGLGSVSEIFDGDPPFAPRGCIAQAWSVAELLRAWQIVENQD